MAGLLFVWAVVAVVLMFSGVPYWARVLIGLAIICGAFKFRYVELPLSRRSVIFDSASHSGHAEALATRESDVTPMPRLEQGGVHVALRAVDVTGTLPKEDAISGLAAALPYLHRAITDNRQSQTVGSGILRVSFRTEADGMIRMVPTGESHADGFEVSEIQKTFTEGAMTQCWRFPASADPSLVEAQFSVSIAPVVPATNTWDRQREERRTREPQGVEPTRACSMPARRRCPHCLAPNDSLQWRSTDPEFQSAGHSTFTILSLPSVPLAYRHVYRCSACKAITSWRSAFEDPDIGEKVAREAMEITLPGQRRHEFDDWPY